METVGVIGLGLMGSALAERIIAAGHQVVANDLRADCCQRLAELGGIAKPTASDVFASARVVVLSLPTSDDVNKVLDSVDRIFPGTRIIDTTTGDPEASARLGQRLAAVKVEYLDATLTGSSQQARAGEVVVTAGGSLEAFHASQWLFRLFARQWFHVGPWGSGATTKLAINLVLGLNRAALAEGLAFGRASGLKLDVLLEILRSGVAYSRAMDHKGPKMIAGDFAAEAKLEQHWKDVRLILEAGQRVGATMPLSHCHEELLADLVRRGFGADDNSCVIRAFDAKVK